MHFPQLAATSLVVLAGNAAAAAISSAGPAETGLADCPGCIVPNAGIVPTKRDVDDEAKRRRQTTTVTTTVTDTVSVYNSTVSMREIVTETTVPISLAPYLQPSDFINEKRDADGRYKETVTKTVHVNETVTGWTETTAPATNTWVVDTTTITEPTTTFIRVSTVGDFW
ncbi:Hypothetical protein D9617_12g037480 [Elsinoe fawcettii]|nr:Hypothetical protein D9617_12g037480 [Elsinoe fawcettii]